MVILLFFWAIKSNVLNILENLKDKDGNRLIVERYAPKNNRLNISLMRSKTLSIDEKFIYKDSEYDISEFGFQMLKRDIGTAYHIPEGIFISIGNANSRLKKYEGQIIETISICPTILDILNVEIPDYMVAPL